MSYVKVWRVKSRLIPDDSPITYSAMECSACNDWSKYANHGYAIWDAHRHAQSCPVIAIAVDRDKLARRVEQLQTALDRLTAATILPNVPPC